MQTDKARKEWKEADKKDEWESAQKQEKKTDDIESLKRLIVKQKNNRE